MNFPVFNSETKPEGPLGAAMYKVYFITCDKERLYILASHYARRLPTNYATRL